MSECKLCNGSLQVVNPPRYDGSTGYFTSCRDCLSYPATMSVRKFGCAWLGFDPWAAGDDRAEGTWWVYDGRPPEVIPVYLGAGRDLTFQILVDRLDCNIPRGARVRAGVTLWLSDDEQSINGTAGDTSVNIDVVGSPTIARDAPYYLRFLRSLVLCLQSSEPSEHQEWEENHGSKR